MARSATARRRYAYGTRPVSLIVVLYVVIGVVVALAKHYITLALLKGILSALLAIFLWFLVLLGIDLHIH